jgi:death-on-curing protein
MAVTRRETQDYAKFIVYVHDRIVSLSGEPKGARGGSITIAAYRILKAQEKHLDLAYHAAIIYDEIARNHYFIEGNKRTAHVLAKMYLYLHGYSFNLRYPDAVSFIMSVAEGKKQIRDIESWVCHNTERFSMHDTNYLSKLVMEVLDDETSTKVHYGTVHPPRQEDTSYNPRRG